MITEHHEHIPDDYMVSVQPVHPWTLCPRCPKCGHGLGVGIPLTQFLLNAFGCCSQTYAYCKGSQDSRARVPTLNIANGEMGVGLINIPCFGIFHEHLHLACNRCRFDWLMECKTRKEVGA
jgi:hypothetical protein